MIHTSAIPRQAEPAPDTYLPTAPRLRGFAAAEAGLPISTCLEKPGTRARTAWLDGFWNFHNGRDVFGVSPKEAPDPNHDPYAVRRRQNNALRNQPRRRGS